MSLQFAGSVGHGGAGSTDPLGADHDDDFGVAQAAAAVRQGLAVSFASPGTWPEALAQLNNFLEAHELGPLSLGGSMDDREIADLVNSVYAIWEVARGRLEQPADTAASRLEADHQGALEQIEDLRERLAQAEKAVWAAEQRGLEQQQLLQSRLKKQAQQVQALDRSNQQLQRRDQQWQHELRKHEQTVQKLQERLQKVLSDRSRDGKLRLELANPLPPNPQRQQHPEEAVAAVSATALLLQDAEGCRSRLQVAEEEAQNLREALAQIGEDLLESLLQQAGDDRNLIPAAALQDSGADYDNCVARLAALNELVSLRQEIAAHSQVPVPLLAPEPSGATAAVFSVDDEARPESAAQFPQPTGLRKPQAARRR